MKNIFLFLLILFIFESCSPKPTQMLYTITPEAKLKELGIEIPKASPPVANYVNVVRTGNLLYTAGKGPNKADGTLVTGKVGKDLSIEEGYHAAQLCAIQLISLLKEELGDLSKVKRIVKVLGMVNCETDFTSQPEVINGCSDFLVKVFGDRGKHARSAVGMGSLPRNIAVEVELIVEVVD
jgi:enamine deaminase RidA (YjgF/YER057c/UK114 family)